VARKIKRVEIGIPPGGGRRQAGGVMGERDTRTDISFD
jgi:hypothetical protein